MEFIYRYIFQQTTLDKSLKQKELFDSDCLIRLKDRWHKFVLFLSKTNIKYKITVHYQQEIPAEKPVIYAVTHFSAQDAPIMCNAVKERAYLLVGRQRLGILELLFFHMYGTIFVDRKNSEDMRLSKAVMLKCLSKGKSIIMCPEGTWNLDDARLVLQMKWGIIDVAMQSGSPIVPVCLDYSRKTMECRVEFGKPIHIKKDADKAVEISVLRDTLATMKWYMIEGRGINRRSEMNMDEEREEFYRSIKEFPKIDMEYETSVVYGGTTFTAADKEKNSYA